MNIKKLSPFVLAFVLAGCIPVLSLNPLYDDKHLVFDEKLLGSFTEPNGVTWEFTRAEDSNSYVLTYTTTSESNKVLRGLLAAHLVKLDSRLFLDVYPKENPWADEKELEQTKWFYNAFLLVSTHSFIKIDSLEPQFKVRFTDDEQLKKLLTENPKSIEYNTANDSLVLTDTTEKLQAFVLKYADDDRLFTEEHVLTPQKSKTSPDQNQTPKDANN